MNLISEIESELAFAVLIEKRHAEKIDKQDVLPLIKRLNDALESVSAKEAETKAETLAAKQAGGLSH